MTPASPSEFTQLASRVLLHGIERPGTRALVQDDVFVTYAELASEMGRIAGALARDGVHAGDVVGLLCATTSASVAAFLGILAAGGVPAPLAPSSTPRQIAAMIADCNARIVFADDEGAALLANIAVTVVPVDRPERWLDKAEPVAVAFRSRQDVFNIIYSSGTTGTPKGILHTHGMRATQIDAYAGAGLDTAVTMVSTPLYSNTTLVSLLPTLAYGGTAVLLGRFDARRFLEVSARERATHAMLVPVQYQRIMSVPDFDAFDLTAFRIKTCTSAPFSAELKADVVRRWPGLLIEIYAMTEGGGTTMLLASAFPHKLHTVGLPAPGSDVRIVGEDGRELPRGEIGEVVGRSAMMMKGYHGRQQATDDASWHDAEGNRFIRHGDLGRFDDDGFLILMGRTKDMIISGGFNVYPPDIEAVMLSMPGLLDAAVVGAPSEAWGETPHAFFVADSGGPSGDAVVTWVNERVGKTQRLSGATRLPELPRNVIGKVLKRNLRNMISEGMGHE